MVQHESRGSRLLFVGRLASVKGLPVLLEALAEIVKDRPDVKLTIAGDGPDRAALESMAARLNLTANVAFSGYRSQAQVRELLQQTDVFVLPSFAEGVPVVLMEAMAAGVPVVTTRIAGIPELVEDGVSGSLTSPGDAQNLRSAIVRLLEDPDLRRRFGREGRKTIEDQFDINKEAAWLCEILGNALAGKVMPVRPVAADMPVISAPVESTAHM
jgi:glycosyltransferase involved in cell wall biosynthesis